LLHRYRHAIAAPPPPPPLTSPLQELEERLGSLVRARVDWSPSNEARATAMAKIAREAATYDRNNGELFRQC
jgi:hypothetical protein